MNEIREHRHALAFTRVASMGHDAERSHALQREQNQVFAVRHGIEIVAEEQFSAQIDDETFMSIIQGRAGCMAFSVLLASDVTRVARGDELQIRRLCDGLAQAGITIVLANNRSFNLH